MFNKNRNDMGNYRVVRIKNFDDISPYKKYAPDWCIFYGEEIFLHYTDNGRKSFFFCIEKDALKIKAEDGEKYAKSVVAVLMREDGTVESMTGRDNKEDVFESLEELCKYTEISKSKFIMTFEAYKKFAMNRPHPTGPSFFRLEMVITDTELDEDEPPRYPEYDVHVRERLYFRTLEAAEAKIAQLKTEYVTDEDITVIGYFIEEYPFCEGEYAEESMTFSTISWRLYDDNGVFIDQSKASEISVHYDTEYDRYLGRDKSELRFKEGEIVEVYCPHSKKIRLYVMCYHSLSLEFCWENFKGNGAFCFDCTDDSVYVIDSFDDAKWDHEHISPEYLFKPHFPIPDNIRKHLEDSYKAYCEAVERNRKKMKKL